MTQATPIRVLFVLPSFAGGGAERVMITLLNALSPARFERHLLVINPEGPLRDLPDAGVKIHHTDKAQVRRALGDVARCAHAVMPDVMVSTMAHLNFALLLIKPFFPRGMKLIVREAITPSYFHEKSLKSFFIDMGYRLLYPHADMVLAPAQKIIDEFRDYIGLTRARFACLFNPVDMDRVRGPQPYLLAHRQEDRARTVHFIAAGRLDNQKGFDQLIEALPFLGDELAPGTGWTLTILGEGEKRPKIENFIRRHGMEHRVRLPGFAAAPWPQIGMADAYLLPSRYEGLPNVALESLAVGTPVIALASAGGVDEIAVLAAPGAVTVVPDMPAMIDAMRRVMPDARPGYRASLLPDDFTFEAVLPRLEAILEACVAGTMPAPQAQAKPVAAPSSRARGQGV